MGLVLRDPHLALHCLRPPSPLGVVAREEEGTRPHGGTEAGPAGLDHCFKLRASATIDASVAFGLAAEVLLAGPARPPTLLPFQAQNERDRRSAKTAISLVPGDRHKTTSARAWPAHQTPPAAPERRGQLKPRARKPNRAPPTSRLLLRRSLVRFQPGALGPQAPQDPETPVGIGRVGRVARRIRWAAGMADKARLS
jgi:hypothetical protein